MCVRGQHHVWPTIASFRPLVSGKNDYRYTMREINEYELKRPGFYDNLHALISTGTRLSQRV